MARRRREPPGGVRVTVVNRTRSRLPARGALVRGAGLALARLRPAAGGRRLATTLVCVGRRRMRVLNARFRGRRELTDVLSFGEHEVDPEDGSFRAGDVVICSEVARRQARRRKIRARDELLLYAIHGWLHLAGYRDGTERRRSEMARAERRIMRRLGVRRS